MPVGGDQSQARDVGQIDAIGPVTLETDNSIVFEQGRQYRRDYSYQDVYRWDAKTGDAIRLTTGKRARDPAVSRDGRRIAFSMNERSASMLAVIDAVPEADVEILWKGERYDQAFQPAWSPDGTRIAFSAWRRGGYRDILVIDVPTKQVNQITRDRLNAVVADHHRIVRPWQRDGVGRRGVRGADVDLAKTKIQCRVIAR